MLAAIEEMYRKEALTLLRWLVYAKEPPSLGELAEAAIVDPEGDIVVDTANRGSLEDTLQILCGLVTRQRPGNDDDSDNIDNHDEIDEEVENIREEETPEGLDSEEGDGSHSSSPSGRVNKNTKIRLAHFSVKEYLESERILQSQAKDFYLENAKEQDFLARSCLTYLISYSGSEQRTSTVSDLEEFPLLRYAARSWYYHSSLKKSSDISREACFLSSEAYISDWLMIHQPEKDWGDAFGYLDPSTIGSGIYYASCFGLEAVVNELLRAGSDINAQGGDFRSPLHVAMARGYEKIVEILIDQGADINAQGGRYGNALHFASSEGNEKIVELLIERGADINAHGGRYGNALQAASSKGHKSVVKILLERGADVDAHGFRGTPLHVASLAGYEKVVEMLIEQGADINAQTSIYGVPLYAASYRGREKVVKILLERGADVNAQGGVWGNALNAACYEGHKRVVEILIAQGADVNAGGGGSGSALQIVLRLNYLEIARMLRERGAVE